MKKVSVLLPSYNVAPYIRQCLESVLAQTLSDLEILCMDAGSTDGTKEILEEYVSKDERIRLFHSEKKSYGYQMNIGIREAKGEYIGIVETDDFVEPDMFKTLYWAAKRNDADIVKSARFERYEFENSETLDLPICYLPGDRQSNVALLPDEDPMVHRWDSYIWNGIYRTSMLRDQQVLFRETPGAVFQDISFFHLSMNAADRVVYVRNPLYHNRKHRPGASTWNLDCVHYFCNEYRYLFASGRIKESRRKSIYLLMLPTMIAEIDKMLSFAGDAMEAGEYDEDIAWYEREVREAFESGFLRPEEVPEGFRDRLLLFLADRRTYIRRYRGGVAGLSDWLARFRERMGDRRLILFGAGNYGTNLFQFLIRNGVRPEAFADNNMWFWNYTLFGLPVFTADEAAVHYRNAYFLICSRNGSDAIKKQLIDWDIPEDQIGVFSGNPDMVRVLRTWPVLQGIIRSHNFDAGI